MKKKFQKINLQNVKNMPPESIIADDEITGFIVKSSKKNKRYLIQKRFKNKLYEKTIGYYPEMKPDEARAEALAYVASIINYEQVETPIRSKVPTVGEAIDYYLPKLKRQSDAKYIFRYWDHLRDVKITELTKKDILEVKESLKDKPETSNHAVRYLGTAINKISTFLEVNLPNPALNIPKYPTSPRTRFLSEKEAPLLIQNLKEMKKSRIYKTQVQAIFMMIYTGQRVGNVLAMNLNDIHDGIWTVKKSESKNGKPIQVPLNEYAIAIVNEQKSEANADGYLFVRRGMVLKNIKKTLLTACKKSGIIDCHPHDLRRTLGSWMLMNGTPIAVVSRMLGHSSIRVTEQVYAHLLPKKISDATESAVGAMLKGKI